MEQIPNHIINTIIMLWNRSIIFRIWNSRVKWRFYRIINLIFLNFKCHFTIHIITFSTKIPYQFSHTNIEHKIVFIPAPCIVFVTLLHFSIYHTISQVRTVSSSKSRFTALPITISINCGGMPVPGRLAVRSPSLITSPPLMRRVITSERLASRRGTASQARTVFSPFPSAFPSRSKFAAALLKSSGSPAW